MKFLWYSLRVTSTQGMPLSGLLWHLRVSIQTLWSIAAGLCRPAPMTWFSALAAVVSHTCPAFPRPFFWLFLQKPLGKIVVCTAYIPLPWLGVCGPPSSLSWYCCHMHTRVLSRFWSLTILRSPLASHRVHMMQCILTLRPIHVVVSW